MVIGQKWLDDKRFIYSITEPSWDSKYSISEVGTFLYNIETKTKTRIFNYVLNADKDTITSLNSDGVIYMVAGGFVWKVNIITNEKEKVTTQQDNSIFHPLVHDLF